MDDFDRLLKAVQDLSKLDGKTRTTAAPVMRPSLSERLSQDDEGAMARMRLESAQSGTGIDEGDATDEQLTEQDEQVIETMLKDILGEFFD